MTTTLKYSFIAVSLGCFLSMLAPTANGAVSVQCPGDLDGDAMWVSAGEPDITDPAYKSGVTRCIHLAAGDGFITMADDPRTVLYTFGFSNMTGIPTNPTGAVDVLQEGMLAAAFPAPLIALDEGDEFYLTLTNVGMMMRPDLFDPHTVHYHGFPQAASIFDGVPDASISINMGSSLTYYYKINDPGTYMYHCHVEAAEHMQMGMLGNLYVRPAQNRLPDGTMLGTHPHSNPDYNVDPGLDDPLNGDTYAYNDGDGSTIYDVDIPLQVGSFDSEFHILHLDVQPLPFALMFDDYPMLNGRGYPDTVNPAALPGPNENGNKVSQAETALVTAAPGQKVLLRISSLSVTRYYTLGIMGTDMTIIGKDAKLLRGPDGKNLYYKTNSVTIGGGESYDAIVEIPAGATPGTTYFVYATNLNYLTNNTEEFGGMMTEIRVN